MLVISLLRMHSSYTLCPSRIVRAVHQSAIMKEGEGRYWVLEQATME
jgi:hypothetical protein